MNETTKHIIKSQLWVLASVPFIVIAYQLAVLIITNELHIVLTRRYLSLILFGSVSCYMFAIPIAVFLIFIFIKLEKNNKLNFKSITSGYCLCTFLLIITSLTDLTLTWFIISLTIYPATVAYLITLKYFTEAKILTSASTKD